MDIASTLMGLGLLLMFVAPVGFMVYNQANKEKKRTKKLAFLAGKNGYRLDETENLQGLSLALDRSARKFFLLRSGDKAELQTLDLSNITKIDLLKVDEDGHNTSSLDEIREIALVIKGVDHPDKKLIFYAEEEDPVTQKTERLDKAIKWQKSLQKHSRK
ncbi:hypothetical protein [Salinimicrobium sp. HB62]|uniref:hypothetical protein n=1 Tax=Salinimicrobium sp. HB62 TaxID=3077781 RepID=UPI002D798309|nr:hypothetical protein [Salinimicrobium sp. HB62]